jgi:diguanylate cyclase (GGDEF)-like protein/PAS domain S-box-containing protein
MTANLAKVMSSRDELNKEMEERRQLAEALQESERKYRSLVENALVGVYKSDLKGDLHYANTALTRMLEFGSSEELISAGVIARYKNPRDREALLEGLRKTGRIEDFEAELITKTGKTINILLSAVLDNDMLSGMVMDITARKRNEEQLQKTHRELSALYNISSAISRTIDMDMLLNNILNTLIGLDILDVEHKAGIFIIEGEKMELVSHLGHSDLFLNSHKDMKLGDCLCGLAAKTGEIIVSYDSDKDDRHTFRYPDMTPHGHIILPLKAKEKVVGVLYLYLPADAQLNDEKMKMLITAGDQIGMAIDHARLYEETKALSLHDSLTGLSNRHFFNKIIEREMAAIKRKDETVSFIMIDLDHFKEINDTLGHLAGDRILIEAANLIKNTVRKADLVFRFGGDEFLVLLTNTDCDKTTSMVTRLQEAVGIWNKDNAEAFGCSLSLSLGCAICEKECDIHTAIKKADERMYQNKREKKHERNP